MEIIPSTKVTRFEQLQPGDLFICLDGEQAYYALKTQPANGDRSMLTLLGPSFFRNITESFLLPWRGATVLSLGKNFSIFLPTDPSALSLSGPSRTPVCLAISEDNAYICTNGGHGPSDYYPCYVDVKTGAIMGRPTGSIVFTTNWEIAVLGANHPPLSILKYPL
jgi:hypothetical protein